MEHTLIIILIGWFVGWTFLLCPLILFYGAKLFRVGFVSFKSSIVASLLIFMSTTIVCLLALGFRVFGGNELLVRALVLFIPIPIWVWVIASRLDASIGRAVGITIFSIIMFSITYSALRTFIVQPYKIPAKSMQPTILKGDYVLVNKYIYYFKQPRRGDIVVFPYPKDPVKDYIKRLVALEGDTVEIRDKQLFINQRMLQESYVVYVEPSTVDQRDNFGPTNVPPNSVFVLGDNRDRSADSRFWGFVDSGKVKGRADTIYWSWDQENFRVRWKRIGMALN